MARGVHSGGAQEALGAAAACRAGSLGRQPEPALLARHMAQWLSPEAEHYWCFLCLGPRLTARALP